jgi:hypothetical protein
VRGPADPAAASFRLVWPRQPAGGLAGARLGRANGASLEFQDYRDYVAGDDLRHVDWRAYARTDQLKVRLFREEVAPALDVLRDVSASMQVTEAKANAAAALVDALRYWGEAGGGHPRVHEIVGQDSGYATATPLRRGGVRVLLSDFLVPGDPAPHILRLASGAALLVVVQLLDPWEIAPSEEGALALIDCEDQRRLDLVLDATTTARYRARLQRLCANVDGAVRRLGGRFATVAAGPLREMVRGALVPAGIVEVA